MTLDGIGARLYAGPCASCHKAGELVALALNTNLYNAPPDNVIQAVLRGVAAPGLIDMPSFADSSTDAQVAQLAAHLRTRFAPAQPAWSNLERIAGAV